MNDETTNNTPQQNGDDALERVIGAEGGAPVEAMPVEAPRRAASLTLRQDDARVDRAASMEAANKSLADALRIAYRFLQGVMVLIIVLFALSGYQQVNESEQGLRLRFGAVQEGVVEPGPHLSWPKGFGEIVRTSRTQQQYQLSSEFMPSRYNPQRDVDQQGTGTMNLVPGADGSLITADGRIVHLQAALTFRRTDIRAYCENVHPDYEEDIVKAMTRRAIVHAAASTPIDDLLTRTSLGATIEEVEGSGDERDPATSAPSGTSSPSASLEGRLRGIVNDQIADANYGITMDSVSIGLITPPLRIRQSFRQALESESQAQQLVDGARRFTSQIVNSAAGTASQPLLALMDEYEQRIDLGNETGAEEILGEIFAILDGDRDGANVEILSETYNQVTLGGAAAEVVGEALRNSRTLGDIARRESDNFSAKLEQYRANPRGFLVREWTEAMNEFLVSDSVQVYLVPPGLDRFDLWIDDDPEIIRQRQRELLRRAVRDNPNMRAALGDNPEAAALMNEN